MISFYSEDDLHLTLNLYMFFPIFLKLCLFASAVFPKFDPSLRIAHTALASVFISCIHQHSCWLFLYITGLKFYFFKEVLTLSQRLEYALEICSNTPSIPTRVANSAQLCHLLKFEVPGVSGYRFTAFSCILRLLISEIHINYTFQIIFQIYLPISI